MNYLADKSYLAVKPEATPGTPVIPDNFIPLISESIRVNPNISADRRFKGLTWKSDDVVRGTRLIEGDLVIHADPDSIGHMLNMVYEKGVTTGSAPVGYTHPFTVGEGKHYSIEISRGDFAQRIWGVRGENLKIAFQDNKMIATLSIKALGQFNTASLAVALTGVGMTSAVLKQIYDTRPTDGLVAGDVIRIGAVDITLTSVNADGVTVGFAATDVTASIGDPVFLVAQTPSYSAIVEPLYLGNTLVGVAATSALADTAAATKATATPCYNLAMDFKNNLLDAIASGATGAAALLNQVREASAEISRLFENPTQYQKWIEYVKQAITMITKGTYIKSDNTTWEQLTFKLHKVKLISNEQPLDVGQYLFDKQKFEALYDSVDGKAIEVNLVNRTAGTEY